MKKLRLSAAVRSGCGKVRKNNEDAFYFNGRFAELSEMDREAFVCDSFEGEDCLFAICDGMGGHENGELASFTAVSRMPMLQSTLKHQEFPTAMQAWTEETNRIVYRTAHNGGSTLATLYFQEGLVYSAHIGDSRIYRYHEGHISRVTKDHSKLQVLLDAGLITEKDIANHPDKHVITRCLGMREDEEGQCLPTVQGPIHAEKDDRYLICSDGVTDMLSDSQIENLLSQHVEVKECTSAIYQAALDAGGKDNTSIMVIAIEQEEEDTSDAQRTDDYERTLDPTRDAEPISIEQVTTIRQANGQKITVKSYISGFQQERGVPWSQPVRA